MPSTASPISWPTRSRISRAALLVKVTAQDLARVGAAGRDKMGEARGERGRLARAGTGQHQHGPFGGQHGLALRLVEAFQIRGRRREWEGVSSRANS